MDGDVFFGQKGLFHHLALAVLEAFVLGVGEPLPDVDALSEEVGLFADQQVQEDLAAGEDLADAGLEPVAAAGVAGVEADGVDLFLSGDEDGPLVVEPLADDGIAGLPENLLCPHYGIQRPEPRIVEEDDAVRHSLLEECFPHSLRLVVVPPMIVAADDDPVHLPRLVEGGAGVDPVGEVFVGGSPDRFGRRPQQEGGMPVGNVLDAGIGTGPPHRPDAHVAVKDGAA